MSHSMNIHGVTSVRVDTRVLDSGTPTMVLTLKTADDRGSDFSVTLFGEDGIPFIEVGDVA